MRKLLFFILAFYCSNLNAQTLQVVPFSLEQDLRFLQVNGKFDSSYSLTIRPFHFNKQFTPDSLYNLLDPSGEHRLRELKKQFLGKQTKISLLPLNTISRFTSNAPFSWSDGLMLPSKGFQQYVSLGFYSAIGPLRMQIAPEILFAQNLPYKITPLYGEPNPISNLKRYSFGQTRITLDINAFSLGLSNENIWWGPGQNTSLMMTNNAPGFLHATFNTTRPVKTFLGNFEWQIIAGKLNASDKSSEDVFNRKSFYNVSGYETIQGEYSKYINGINFAFQPSFLKGLYLGFNRVFVAKSSNLIGNISNRVGLVSAYLPIFDGLFKEKRISFEDGLQWNQLASLYARYILKKAKAEIYFEYGWNDHAFNMRDLMTSPNHSSAYLIGIRKDVELKKHKYIDLSIEYNQMSQPINYLVRDAGSWYIHGDLANLSNSGESLGSGVGYGTDLLTMSAIIRNGLNNFGLKFNKISRQKDRYQPQWNDFSLTGIIRRKMNSFIINLDLTVAYSKNYGWVKGDTPFNFIGLLGVSYYW
jgi:hypothetical protein